MNSCLEFLHTFSKGILTKNPGFDLICEHKHLLFIHWCMYWSPCKNGRRDLLKIKQTVLNYPATAGGKFK